MYKKKEAEKQLNNYFNYKVITYETQYALNNKRTKFVTKKKTKILSKKKQENKDNHLKIKNNQQVIPFMFKLFDLYTTDKNKMKNGLCFFESINQDILYEKHVSILYKQVLT